MTPRLRLLALSSLVLTACGLDLAASANSTASRNDCEGASDCPGGSCVEGSCRQTGTLRNVLIEVTPPLGGPGGNDVSFLKRLDGLVPSGGNQDIDVGLAAKITGHVAIDPVRAALCMFKDELGGSVDTGSDGTIPAKVVFMPAGRLPGLVTQEFSARATPEGSGRSATFALSLPSGVYDILVQPFDQPEGEGCDVVPVLYRNRSIESPSKQVELNLNLLPPSTLDITVSWPADGFAEAPEKWTADVLHPQTGVVLSRPVVLAKAEKLADGTWQTQATLTFSAVEPGELVGKELIRLVPPERAAGPSLVLARETLSIFGGRATIDHFTKLPNLSIVEGHVTDENAAPVSRAVVTFTALTLDGVVDSWGSYTKFVETDLEGHFSASVFAGSYSTRVVPPAGLDLAAEIWPKIDLSEARVVDVELHPTRALGGDIRTPLGDAFTGAMIQAVPVPLSLSVIDQALDRTGIMPSAANGQVEAGHIHSFALEPGTFHVSVRPGAGSDYPWLVIPNVQAGGTLGQRDVPFPVVYEGRMLSGGAPLAGALVRAYVYLGDQGTPVEASAAATLIQVAETRVLDTGQFKLLLPPRLESATP